MDVLHGTGSPSQNAVIPICPDWVTVAVSQALEWHEWTRTGKLCRADVGLSQRGLRDLSRHPNDAAGTHLRAKQRLLSEARKIQADERQIVVIAKCRSYVNNTRNSLTHE